MRLFYFLIIVLCYHNIEAQTITTIAGTGLSGLSGDGGPATLAKVVSANGGAFDSYGNYYFADNLGEKIRRIDTAGVITTIAGTGVSGFSGDGGAATLAKLYHPNAVTTDGLDNIYIADFQNNRIRKVNRGTGIITTIAGNGTGAFGGDGGTATSAKLFYPNDLCFDGRGDLYISDMNNYRVRKVSTSGIITTIAGSGSSGYSGDGGAATAARFTPYGVCLDANFNLYIADNSIGETRVARVDTTGIISTFAGTDTGYIFNGNGIPATTANISPIKILFKDNELYLADFANNRIRKIDTSGIIHNVAGCGIQGYSGDGGVADSAKLYHPSGVAFDRCGNFVFPDLNNYRIRKVTIPYTHTPAPFSITPTPHDTLCSGNPVTFTTHTTATGTLSFQWKVNGTNVGSGGFSYTYTPANGDNVKCILINTMPCYIDTISSNTIHITTTTLGISLAGPFAALMGTPVTINATVTGADSSYSIEWRNRGVLFNTTTVPTVTYTKAVAVDSITARLISTSQSCTGTANSGVHVVGENVSVGSPDSYRESGVGSLSVYPNPVGGELFIEAGALMGDVVISNLLGHEVRRVQYAGAKTKINVEQLASGMYFIKVGEVVTRFVKR